MGIETIIAAASVAASAGSAVMQRNQAKKAMAAQENANQIQENTEKRKNLLARRKSAREARIRRAMVAQASTNQGTGVSSAAAGTQAGIGAQFGASSAAQQGELYGALGVSRENQNAANAQFKQEQIAAYEGLAQRGLGLAYKSYTGNDLY